MGEIMKRRRIAGDE